MEIGFLEEFGLTQNESRVYLNLLENGPLVAGDISKNTGIHRRNVYDSCERLIKKGILGYVKKNNRRYFEAVRPDKLKEIIEKKNNLLTQKLEELNKLFLKKENVQDVSVFVGAQGLKNIFEDQLIENNEVLILGASSFAEDILPFYFKWYDEKRVKKKIKARIISSDNLKKIPLSEVKYLPQKYSNPLAVNIYKDKVALVLWKSENAVAILIKDKTIADSYRKYFEVIWKTAKS